MKLLNQHVASVLPLRAAILSEAEVGVSELLTSQSSFSMVRRLRSSATAQGPSLAAVEGGSPWPWQSAWVLDRLPLKPSVRTSNGLRSMSSASIGVDRPSAVRFNPEKAIFPTARLPPPFSSSSVAAIFDTQHQNTIAPSFLVAYVSHFTDLSAVA